MSKYAAFKRRVTRTVLFASIGGMLLFPIAAAGQQIPALLNLPATVSSAHPDLASWRDRLLHERDSLHARVMSQRAQCSAVDEGSSQASACVASRASLSGEVKLHIEDSQAFNAAAQRYQCASGFVFAADADRCQPIDNSPSLPANLDPSTRARFQSELAELEAERLRAEKELAKVSTASHLIEGGTLVNWRIRQDLTADSLINSLKVVEGFLAIYGPTLPPGTLQADKVMLGSAQAAAHAYAAADSEANSERQFEQARGAFNSLNDVLVEAASGADPGVRGVADKLRIALRQVADDAKALSDHPAEKGRAESLANALGQVVETGEKVPVVGAPLGALNGAANLTDTAIASSWWLRLDAEDLRQAGSQNQTARLYWQKRLEKIESLEPVYRASLGGASPN